MEDGEQEYGSNSTNQEKGSNFCPRCGSPSTGNRFCPNCGTDRSIPPMPSQSQSSGPTPLLPYYSSGSKGKKSPLVIVVAIVIVLALISVGVYAAALNTSSNTSGQNNNGNNGNQDTNTNSYVNQCGYNYSLEFTDKINQGFLSTLTWSYPSGSGNHFVVVNLKVVNNGVLTMTTNPFCWQFESGGVGYDHSSSSYAETFNEQTVDIKKGGAAVTEIVYEVPSTVTSGEIVWTDPYASKYPDYVYRDTSISVVVPMTIDAPVAHSDAHMRAFSGGHATVKVNWSSVPRASVFEIQTSSTSDFATISNTYSTTADEIQVTCSLQGFAMEGKDFLRVRAYSDWGRAVSDWSNTITWELYLGGYNEYPPYGF